MPEALAHWLPPNGVTNQKFRHTDEFEDSNLPGTMYVTAMIKKCHAALNSW